MSPFRAFLVHLAETLMEALRQAENLQWHHEDESSSAFQTYLRLMTMLHEVQERGRRYDYVKAQDQPDVRWTGVKQGREPEIPVAGSAHRLHAGDWSGERTFDQLGSDGSELGEYDSSPDNP